MAVIKAWIFDFIGTLATVKNYDMRDSELRLHKAIMEAGFNVETKDFLDAYGRAHEKYRVIRYQELIEVTNAVWISDALNDLGSGTTPNDTRIRTAVNIFFEDYLNSLELRPCVTRMLKRTSSRYKTGLISNFTYAPVIHAALRKLDINRFFNAILVSEDVGWRKPNRRIFEEALRRLKAGGEETVYVGDSPLEDIEGAKASGMKTIFVPSQFYSLETLHENQVRPDLIVKDVCELHDKFEEFMKKGQS